MINQRGFISATLVVIIVVLAVFMVGVAWYYEENKEEISSETVNTPINSNSNINSSILHNTNSIASNELFPKVAYLDSGNIYSLSLSYADVQLLVSNATPIIEYDISDNGQHIIYLVASDNESEIHYYNVLDENDSVVLKETNVYYHSIALSPDNTKIAYAKKNFNSSVNKFLNQAIYVSDLNGNDENKIVDIGKTEDEVSEYYGNDVCEWSNDSNLIGLEKWSPESDYLVYYINDNYECSGPGHSIIHITDLNGNESFFDEHLPNPGTYIFNEEEREWSAADIFWQTFSSDNGDFILKQRAGMPFVNSRVVFVKDGEVVSAFNTVDYQDDEYQNNTQRLRSHYEYGFDVVGWDERISYFGGRAGEPGTNEVIKTNIAGGNIIQLTNTEDDLAFTHPIVIDDEYVLFRRYNIDPVTNQYGNTSSSKSDTYDILVKNVENNEETIITEGAAFNLLKIYRLE
ncbi:hypothetical protein ACFL0L_01575 [Patescibacteria group bacterium]